MMACIYKRHAVVESLLETMAPTGGGGAVGSAHSDGGAKELDTLATLPPSNDVGSSDAAPSDDESAGNHGRTGASAAQRPSSAAGSDALPPQELDILATTHFGYNVLHYACIAPDARLVRMLLQHAASKTKNLVEQRERGRSRTPLLEAVALLSRPPAPVSPTVRGTRSVSSASQDTRSGAPPVVLPADHDDVEDAALAFPVAQRGAFPVAERTYHLPLEQTNWFGDEYLDFQANWTARWDGEQRDGEVRRVVAHLIRAGADVLASDMWGADVAWLCVGKQVGSLLVFEFWHHES